MDSSDEEDSTDWLQEAKSRKIRRKFLLYLDLKDQAHTKELYDRFGVSSAVEKQISLLKFVSDFRRNHAAKGQQPQEQLDVTVAWTNSESEAVVTHADYGGNNMQKLAAFLKEEPSNRAPVSRARLKAWKGVVPENEVLKYCQPDLGGDTCEAMGHQLTGLLLYPVPIVGENEDGYHSRMDQCISACLFAFAPEFKLRRNSSQDSNSYPLKRPDFSATIPSKGCFFRGEEKKLDSNENPREELYSKLEDIWPFPGLLFVLGYYAVGPSVTFCAVSKNNAEPIQGLTLDLNNALGRLRCWNTMRNVSRVIKFMATTSNSLSPNDLQDLDKKHSMLTDWSRRISFSGGHVLKQIYLRDEETQARLDRCQAVLGRLRNGVAGVQQIVFFTLSSSVENKAKRRRMPPCLMVLTAFGVPIARIASASELRQIVQFLLKTIEQMHNLGITHRDIRLPNIVKNGDGSYGLIDWDESVVGLDSLPNADVAHLVKETHAPEMGVEGGTHDHTVDLWSVGYLIHTNNAHGDEALAHLKDSLMMPEPCNRLSVEEALKVLG